MTVKTAVSFTNKHHEFARKKVEEGSFASVSSVVASALEQAIKDEEERDVALEAMKETIHSRMELPKDQWIPWEQDNPVQKAIDRLKARHG